MTISTSIVSKDSIGSKHKGLKRDHKIRMISIGDDKVFVGDVLLSEGLQ